MARNLNNVPFAPAKWPVFYGWVVLACGTVGIVMSLPGQTMGVSVFTDSLMEALNLSRFQLSLAYMFGTIASSLVLTPAGSLYDRYGARACCTIVAILLGVTLVGLSRVDRIAGVMTASLSLERYAVQISFFTVLVGFLFLRFLGQGMLTVVSRNMIVKWFDKKRGLAVGISGVFASFGFSSAPLFLEALIQFFGWRGAWICLATIVGLAFSSLALLFYRDNPEDCGLAPDGEPVSSEEGCQNPADTGSTLRQAVGTYAFWIFNLGLAMLALFATAMTFHVTSIFEQAGMDRAQAVSIFFPASILSVFMNLAAGRLSDWLKLKYLLIVLVVGILISSVALCFLRPGFWVWTLILGSGLSGGMFNVLMSVTWPRFYGRAHLGTISGFNMSTTVFFSALGPSLFALSERLTGAYAGAAWFCAALSVLLIVMAFWADNPHPGEAY